MVGAAGVAVVRQAKALHSAGSNLFQLAFAMENFGVGVRFKRNTWRGNDCFWTITKMQRISQKPGDYRGVAYGKKTWKGIQDDREREITRAERRGWRYIDEV
mmetsp:Transcript_657/g.1728  ORF Transcript_657/g.1728 Transcript_657/m.1728 type:complete len:102 (+) Transcript_657:107-412(+)|eukprot:CAMPEP_0119153614 /NCGR_PEP_ID=MMETSP1310-20130426/49506_1 /TAXON_ID=464262 /ORGANISM="Genus nov. species nov., Strain RCC2339" /LENGTH=101 /DNA_ID=CAMNT_0007146077 /DNA_START=98 /DNA_END=403 /DNA_ORIENTATION=-